MSKWKLKNKKKFAECGVINSENRIVGGQPSEPHRYPWIARLVYEGKFHCGGSLLTNDYILTAAHCLRRWIKKKPST